MYDVIILGAGPAGMTAAIYAARKQMKQLLISPDIGGQAIWASKIDNYPGFRLISGFDLALKFEKHMKEFKIEQVIDEAVSLEFGDLVFRVKVRGGSVYEGRSLIVASGKSPRDLDVPGVSEFKGKGVAYCATCDAPMYADEDVAVAGSGNAGLQAAVQLAKIARRVYMIDTVSELSGDPILRRKLLSYGNVEMLLSARIVRVNGSKLVESVTVMNLGTGNERTIPVTGIFVAIGSVPNSAFLPESVTTTDSGEVKVDCANLTNIPGLFAAGDVTNVPGKQVVIAAGEGAKASLSAYNYVLHTFPNEM